MKKLFILAVLLSFATSVEAQKYEFQSVIELETLPVISQGNTGTCWSFSTSSFLESEIIRLTGKKIDLSEMYQVRNTYPKKAENYVMRQGKAQFGEGGLAHDVINSAADYGLVPQSAYTGLNGAYENYNHAEMVAVIESMLKTYVEKPDKKLSVNWKNAISAILDVYMGKNPSEFIYENKKYTPQSFLAFTKINPKDYVTITSFTHVPNYKSFILDIPDNFSNGSFYNLPLNEFIANLDNALATGYTVELDCDVSEPTFSSKTGVAVIPANKEDDKTILNEIKPEKEITSQFRQQEFENQSTTDDHLMHIVGKMKDQKGTVYYKVKNSWGTDEKRVTNGGYIYMSVAYMKLKAISVSLHKNALQKETKQNLGL